MKTYFEPSQFTATEFDSAEEKAKFANKLADFLLSGCPRRKFTQWLYEHLSGHFNGHIAHYDANGFYSAWFETPEGREKFLRRMVDYPCYGEPQYTFCDVSRAMQAWYALHQKEVEEALLKRMEEEEQAARKESSRLATAQEKSQEEYVVVAVTKRPGGFGHYGYVVVARDGSAYHLDRSLSFGRWNVREVLTVPLVRGQPQWRALNVELYRRLPNAPSGMANEVMYSTKTVEA